MSNQKGNGGTPLGRFKELARKIVQVPKAELDRKDAEFRRKQAAKKRRK
jgi:hypothetical protein